MGLLPEFLTKEYRLARKKRKLEKRKRELDIIIEIRVLETDIKKKEKEIANMTKIKTIKEIDKK